ncbi:aminotransferase class I/II-fold pyridoxal phosphate-dependent enzyme [uncultured Sphaerochaeta sp.]|uniref:MalY/PatB family protein n=1 Tax=uncultured Sphaerochaeta sp. TaxID=886478 RepID=UPI002A0A7665|nr:aminotransferase class I/II-fold pyridoxal phosphate-dependent enzyme [uncultured Sphaerochaeta sp.]
MKFDFDTTLDHKNNGSYRWGMSDMPNDVIGMGTADLDFNCAPCIREALIPIAQENCYNYRQRPDEYYKAISDWYSRNYGLTVKKEWLSSVPSTIGAIRIALGVYAKPGDTVIVQTPLFSPIDWAINGADCKLIANPLTPIKGHYEIDFNDFEAKIKKYHPSIYLMVNPHNPTGRVFNQMELEHLVEICADNGVTIISDEVHGMIIYDQHKFIPILAVNDKAQEISVQIVSLSKGYNVMSLPHAIITIANPDMQKAWMRQIQAYSFGYATNSFSIAAVTSILKGEADEWMHELNAYLFNNLEETLDYIKEQRLPLIPYRPEGSYLLWIDCHEAGIGTEELAQFFMEKAHILLDDGEENFGSEGKGFIRINFAVTNKILKEALGRIKKAFEEL